MSGGIRQLLRSQSPVQSFNPEETMEQAQSQGSSPPTVPAQLESGESIGQIVRDVNGDLEATLDNAFPEIQVTDEEGNLTDEVQQAVRQVPEGFQFEVVNPDEDAVKQKLSEQDTSAVQSDESIIESVLNGAPQEQSQAQSQSKPKEQSQAHGQKGSDQTDVVEAPGSDQQESEKQDSQSQEQSGVVEKEMEMEPEPEQGLIEQAEGVDEEGQSITNLTMNALDPENENGIVAPVLEAADDFVAQPLADLAEKTKDMVSGGDVSFEGDDSGILGTSISKGEMSDGLAEALRIGLTAVGTAADRQAFQQSFRAVQQSRRAENLDQRIKLKESIIDRIKQAGISGERAAKFADKQFERHFGESAPEEFKTILREGDLEKGTDAVAAQRINTLTYQAMSEMGRAETDEEKKEVVDRYTQLITADPQIPLDKKDDTIDIIRQNLPGDQDGKNTPLETIRSNITKIENLNNPSVSKINNTIDKLEILSKEQREKLAIERGYENSGQLLESLQSRKADSQANFGPNKAEYVRQDAMRELEPDLNKMIFENLGKFPQNFDANGDGQVDKSKEVEFKRFKQEELKPDTQKIDSFLSNFSKSSEGIRAGRAVKEVEAARLRNNLKEKLDMSDDEKLTGGEEKNTLTTIGESFGLIGGNKGEVPRRIPQNVGLYRQGYEILSKSDSILEQTGNLQEQHLSEYLVRLHGDEQINFDKKVTRDLINGEVQRMLMNSSEFSNFNENQIKDATQFILERFPTISSDNPYEKSRQILEDARNEITNG